MPFYPLDRWTALSIELSKRHTRYLSSPLQYSGRRVAQSREVAWKIANVIRAFAAIEKCTWPAPHTRGCTSYTYLERVVAITSVSRMMYDAPEGEPFADADYEILSQWKVDNHTRRLQAPRIRVPSGSCTWWEEIEVIAICVGCTFHARTGCWKSNDRNFSRLICAPK